jgi:hypothetical protein
LFQIDIFFILWVQEQNSCTVSILTH